jgi:hypothetical protein
MDKEVTEKKNAKEIRESNIPHIQEPHKAQ